jgi:hypothetical protein
MTSAKQKIVLAHRTPGELTLAHAVELIGKNIYCNERKHVGAVLTNMVRRGLLVRVRPGVFELPPELKEPPKVAEPATLLLV